MAFEGIGKTSVDVINTTDIICVALVRDSL